MPGNLSLIEAILSVLFVIIDRENSTDERNVTDSRSHHIHRNWSLVLITKAENKSTWCLLKLRQDSELKA